jgi:serine/threonine protein phosphatase 1
MKDALTYAIGDVHGRADLLLQLLDAIVDHHGDRPRRLVFLGDYIDRGPDSAEVVAMLRSLQRAGPGRVTCLAGNHEDMMRLAGRDRAGLGHWIENGGEATLASFGVDAVEQLPDELMAWLADLPTLHEDDARYYVHAGLQPGLAPAASTREHRLWLREDFLGVEHDFGKHVVHGHTPQPSGMPDLRRHRTNLDTAAVFGGALTAGIFSAAQGPPVAYLQAVEDGPVRETRLD